MTPDLALLAALARLPEARLARVLNAWAAAGWTIQPTTTDA